MNYLYNRTPNLDFLGSYEITPAHTLIQVDCYGVIHHGEKQTLEHSGCGYYAELVQVTTDAWVDQEPYVTVDISNYLSSDTWDELEHLINNPK